jgi:hypothetical protein
MSWYTMVCNALPTFGTDVSLLCLLRRLRGDRCNCCASLALRIVNTYRNMAIQTVRNNPYPAEKPPPIIPTIGTSPTIQLFKG